MKDPQVTGPTVLTPVTFFDAAPRAEEPEVSAEAAADVDEEPTEEPVVEKSAPPKD